MTDEWCGTRYSVAKIPLDLVKKIKLMGLVEMELVESNLELPAPNTLIPKNLEILPKSAEFSTKPKLLKEWPDGTDLWYKKDDKFEVPKAIISMKLYTTDCQYGLDAKSRLFFDVWINV